MIIAAMAYQAWALGCLLRVPSEEKGFEYVLMEEKLFETDLAMWLFWDKKCLFVVNLGGLWMRIW